MVSSNPSQRALASLAFVVGVLAISGSARADVVSQTPTLPLLGVPYVPAVGAGCFTTVGVCVSDGTLTMTSVVSSMFGPSGQDIVADATYMATLTTLGNVPIGSVILTGSVEQEVLGRTTATETGSWTTDIINLSLSGPALGHTLTLTLDESNTSSGVTSIVPLGAGNGYSISSFFDVFTELSLDTSPPLQVTRGPIELVATSTPEPASLAVLALPLLLLAATRRQCGRP